MFNSSVPRYYIEERLLHLKFSANFFQVIHKGALKLSGLIIYIYIYQHEIYQK